MHIITDENAMEFLNDNLARSDGIVGLIPRDYDAVPLGSIEGMGMIPFTDAFPLMSDDELNGRIKDMQGCFIRSIYSGTPAEDGQNGLPYCWSFSLSQAVKASRDVMGVPHVDLLSESLGFDVNWRKAGNYCGSAIKAAANRGFAHRSFSPRRYNLQPSTWQSGWEQDALNNRVDEYFELGKIDMRRETLQALVLGFAPYVGLNWAAHAMCFMDIVFVDGKPAIWTPNTHGDGQDWTLTGKKMIPDEAYVVRTSTYSL